MKNPPTLADACVATMLDKSLASDFGNELRAMLALIPPARKFVLDEPMSRYLLDLTGTVLRGGLRKRINQIENARRLARLPHPLTWIECDDRAYFAHARELGFRSTNDPNRPERERCGWLLRQHPKIETAFIATQAFELPGYPGRAGLHPLSFIWCSNDTPLPWRVVEPLEDEAYKDWLAQVGWTFTFSEESSKLVLDILDPQERQQTAPIRTIWPLLATINDLPVTLEHVEPSRGYIARGLYRKFLSHTVVHLTVPETRWRKLVAKTAAILRRRAHQVRGHWRRDWRQPLRPACEHEFDEHMVCRPCGGHQIWIAEHQRGDASLGFVIHDYDVHHEKANTP